MIAQPPSVNIYSAIFHPFILLYTYFERLLGFQRNAINPVQTREMNKSIYFRIQNQTVLKTLVKAYSNNLMKLSDL